MGHTTAAALRRGALAFVGVLATLVAHGVATGHMVASFFTPFVLISASGAVGMATMVGPAIRYRAWGFARTVVSLVAVQLASHVVLWSSPWLYGITGHTHVALVGPFALACHLVVGAAFALLVFHGQRWLARLVGVLVAMLGRRRRSLPRPLRTMRPVLRLVPAGTRGRPRVSRGPPLPVS
jgi:hypothetical protein